MVRQIVCDGCREGDHNGCVGLAPDGSLCQCVYCEQMLTADMQAAIDALPDLCERLRGLSPERDSTSSPADGMSRAGISRLMSRIRAEAPETFIAGFIRTRGGYALKWSLRRGSDLYLIEHADMWPLVYVLASA